ncbi:MAG: Sec-independent protein translocase protein TatB [Sneathiella sp.]|nr:Sec-independent protein translocase protein TatB [Sneathiella sp.]
MFDIGWSEMMFVVIIAVLVIGPKDLPQAISTIGKYVRKARAMARDFQSGINDLARETELADIKKDLEKNTDFNIKKQVEDAVDPTGSFADMINDVKPQIVDPRESAKKIDKADEKATGTEAGKKPETAAVAPPEKEIGTAAKPKADPKPETKAS